MSDPLAATPSLEKPAETQYPIHDLIRKRWSPRAFADRSVEPEKVLSLLEAARWASSSYNQQPWTFIVATQDNPAEYQRLLSTLIEFNQGWAKTAPVLILAVSKSHFDDGKNNRHAFHDVGLALGNLVFQATALDLVVHQAAGFDGDKARKEYQIPNEYEPATVVVVGYPGDPQSLPEGLRDRELAPRARKSLNDLVFAGQWGQTSPLLNHSS